MSALKVGSHPSPRVSVPQGGGSSSVKKASAEARPSAPAFKPVQDGFDRPKAQATAGKSNPPKANAQAASGSGSKSPLKNLIDRVRNFLERRLDRREREPREPAQSPQPQEPGNDPTKIGHNRNYGIMVG